MNIIPIPITCWDNVIHTKYMVYALPPLKAFSLPGTSLTSSFSVTSSSMGATLSPSSLASGSVEKMTCGVGAATSVDAGESVWPSESYIDVSRTH
jgi:hypothetical protein